MTKPNANRLHILTPAEITELFGLPQFGDEERCHYFDTSAQEHQVVEGRRSTAGIFQALELGYFKAKRQFFDFPPGTGHARFALPGTALFQQTGCHTACIAIQHHKNRYVTGNSRGDQIPRMGCHCQS